jgi:hypothetical protein
LKPIFKLKPMKHIFLPILTIAVLSLSSCKKCYTCNTDLPITVNGQVVGSTPFETEECGRGNMIKDKVDGLEAEGYTCEEQ